MSLLRHIVLPILAIFALAVAFALSPIPDQIGAAAVGILGLGYLAWLIRRAIGLFRRDARRLREWFDRIGWKSRHRHFFGISASGLIEGRKASIVFVPLSPRDIVSHLRIELECRAPFRLAMAKKGPLMGCHGCPKVDVADPLLEGVEIRTENRGWAQGFLLRSAVLENLRPILAGEARGLDFQPERLRYWGSWEEAAIEGLEKRLAAMGSLARLTEQADM